jgi:hypothetical protein
MVTLAAKGVQTPLDTPQGNILHGLFYSFPVNPEDIFNQTYPLDPDQQYTGTGLIVDQFTYDRKGRHETSTALLDICSVSC